MKNIVEIPYELRKAIEGDNLMIFVGAGLSKPLNLPDWNKLVNNVIDKTDNNKRHVLKEALNSGFFKPLEILEKLKDEPKAIYDYIYDNFKITDAQNLGVHKKLIALSGKIITTNYDNAFEIADKDIYSAVANSEFQIANLKDKSKYVFYLHGSCTNDESKCVVFEDDYDKLYKEENAANLKFKDIYSSRTLLFIGFSFTDPYIIKLFNYLNGIFKNNIHHYILTTNPKDYERFEYLKPISISDYIEIEPFVDECLKIKHLPKNEMTVPLKIQGDKTKPKIAFLYPSPIDSTEHHSLSLWLTDAIWQRGWSHQDTTLFSLRSGARAGRT